jgi:sulfur carrier protein
VTDVHITVNGAPAEVDEDLTVADLVRLRAAERRQVAVARNGTVVPRAEWPDTRLVPGDTVELLAPVAGG